MKGISYAWRITRVRQAFYGSRSDTKDIEELCRIASEETKDSYQVKQTDKGLVIAVDHSDWRNGEYRVIPVPFGTHVIWDGKRMEAMDTGSFLAGHTLSDPKLKEVVR